MKLLALFSLLFVFSCAALGYRYYGVNTAGVEDSTLMKIRLVAGQRGDADLTLVDCKPNGKQATCILVPVSEFRLIRKELETCREAN